MIDGYAYNEAGWIVIRDWDEHNPGHTRSYTWIQVKKRLLRNQDYIDLTLAERAVLLGLWILTGEHGLGRVTSRPETLQTLLGIQAENDKRRLRRHLVSLNQAGWFTIDACKMPVQKERESKKGSNEPKKENARADEQAPPGLAAHAENGKIAPLPVAPIPPEWVAAIKQMEEDEARYGS